MNDGVKLSTYLAAHYKEKEKLKILHYNAKNNALKKDFEKEGFTNYLGICTHNPLDASMQDLYFEADENVIRKNNSDILILEEGNIKHVIEAMKSSAKRIILIQGNNLSATGGQAMCAAYAFCRRNWTLKTMNLLDNEGRIFRALIFIRIKEKEKEARHYLSPNIGFDDFFLSLNDRGINYVVLRWFDSIPFLDINEDVDLLISDEDIVQVQNMLNENIGILPFDLYSVTGLIGSNFRDVAYYPPYLAKKILNHREVWKGKYYVPDKLHHFLSLLYHVVYHKGEKSGLAFNGGDSGDPALADHDYPAILSQLAADNQIQLQEMNLDYLHDLLVRAGWAPATDTIRKLNVNNDSWMESIVRSNASDFEKAGELMVFIVRERAFENGYTEFIVNYLEKAGLNTVLKLELTPKQKKAASQGLRGGNWGQGPWSVSGGEPAVMLVMYDYDPEPLGSEYRKKYPHVKNSHYLLKEELRKEINSNIPAKYQSNPLHSSDDEIEALDYIEAVAPEMMETVKHTIISWDRAYKTKEKVIKEVSQNKRRAKVELIEYEGKKAIKKTYKAGRERFLEREVYAYSELSKGCTFIPPLLESGENYLIIPYVERIKFSNIGFIKKQFLRKYKKDIFQIAEFFYNSGYAMIDFHPGNILITKEGLKLIDFEFLYKYEEKPESIKDSFDLNGFPDDFEADLPYEVEASERRALWNKILY